MMGLTCVLLSEALLAAKKMTAPATDSMYPYSTMYCSTGQMSAVSTIADGLCCKAMLQSILFGDQ